MNMQTGMPQELYTKPVLSGLILQKLWLDGTDEQEDELDDVAKGILDAPTDNEGPGEIFESNKRDIALETEDEKGL